MIKIFRNVKLGEVKDAQGNVETPERTVKVTLNIPVDVPSIVSTLTAETLNKLAAKQIPILAGGIVADTFEAGANMAEGDAIEISATDTLALDAATLLMEYGWNDVKTRSKKVKRGDMSKDEQLVYDYAVDKYGETEGAARFAKLSPSEVEAAASKIRSASIL